MSILCAWPSRPFDSRRRRLAAYGATEERDVTDTDFIEHLDVLQAGLEELRGYL